MVSKAFLLGSANEVEKERFHEASEKYKSLFKSMAKNLVEAKYEYYIMGREKEYEIMAKLVGCMRRLGQDIGGLRSAASTQFLLLEQAPSAGGTVKPVHGGSTPLYRSDGFSLLSEGEASPLEDQGILTSIDEIPEVEANSEIQAVNPEPSPASAQDMNSVSIIESPSDLFSKFISHLGPSMVSEFLRALSALS